MGNAQKETVRTDSTDLAGSIEGQGTAPRYKDDRERVTQDGDVVVRPGPYRDDPESGNVDDQLESIETAKPIWTRFLVLMLLARIAETASIASIPTYLPEALEVIGTPSSEIATKSGQIACAYAFGQALSAIPLGYLADRIGRKQIFLFGNITTIWFGTSTNVSQMIMLRFLCGALNGNGGISRSIMADELGERANEGVPFLSGTMAFAQCFGPLFAWFANPLNRTPGAEPVDEVDWRYPYLRPNLYISCLLAVPTMLIVFHKPLAPATTKVKIPSLSDFVAAIVHPAALRVMLINLLQGAAFIAFEDIVPVHFLRKRTNYTALNPTYANWSWSGMGMTKLQFSSYYTLIGIITIITSILLIRTRLIATSTKPMFVLSTIGMTAVMLSVPALPILPPGNPAFVGSAIMFAFRAVFVTTIFGSTVTALKNAIVDERAKSAVHGAGTFATALGRAIGPLGVGKLYDIGLHHHFTYLPFLVMVLPMFYAAWVGYNIKPAIRLEPESAHPDDSASAASASPSGDLSRAEQAR